MDKVMAIIEYQGKILVGKLKPEKIKDFGGIENVFPGGTQEENESTEQTALRETKEETGLDVKIIKLIGERIHPVTGKKLYYYHCSAETDLTNTENAENDDIESLIWVSRDDLLNFIPTLFSTVKEYLGVRDPETSSG